MIDPKSTAGVLLREHDNLTQAAEYAERKARFLLQMQNGLGLDYAEAARQLRAEADRPAFEAWLRQHWNSPGYACPKDLRGAYVHAEVRAMWEARSAKA